MDTKDSSAPAHPSTERDPDETPHACLSGFVFIGHLLEDPDTGDEVEAFDAVPCRRCCSEAEEDGCTI